MLRCPVDTNEASVPVLVPPQIANLFLSGSAGRGHVVVSGAGGGRASSAASAAAAQRQQQQKQRSSALACRAAMGADGGSSGSGSSGNGTANSSSSGTKATSWGAAALRFASSRSVPAGLGGIGLAVGGGIGNGGGIFCGPAHARLLSLLPGRKRDAAGGGKKGTVLIMMSNTGGGHKASAEALKQAFESEHGDGYRIIIVDMWKEHTPPPFNRLCDSYSFLVRYGFLWRLTYGALQPALVHRPYFAAIGAVVSARLMAAFDAYAPDLVVSVHPLMQHIPLAVLRARAAASGAPAPPFATVVTDFTTCHNTWFHPGASRCFVPTEFCAALARRNGVPDDRIVVHGLPIRPVFSRRLPSKRALRAKLGLQRGPPAILVVGGGEGMGALEATVRELDARLGGSAAQVAVICGRNRRLLTALRTAAWPGGTHVAAVGFVDNMHEWMAAADVIITKAGPGTIAEALISGLPILLNGNVPCQEEGNIPYVVDNGVGAFETDPRRIAGVLAGWLAPANAAAFAAMGKRSKALGRPRAVFDIARDLQALVDEARAAARRRATAPPSSLVAAAEPKKSCCGCGGGRKAAPALVTA